jgi:hypothetical protein
VPQPYETWEAPAVAVVPTTGPLSSLSGPPKTTTSPTLSSPFLLSETPDDELQQDQQLKQQQQHQTPKGCVKDQFLAIVDELGLDPFALSSPTSTDDGMMLMMMEMPHGKDDSPDRPVAHVDIPLEAFVRITKELCRFPSFFNASLYQRILDLWNARPPAAGAAAAAAASTPTATTIDALDKSSHHNNNNNNDSSPKAHAVNLTIFEWFWKKEMEPYDAEERLFRLLKQPHENCILRDDLLPYIKALLNEHPVRGLLLLLLWFRCHSLHYYMDVIPHILLSHHVHVTLPLYYVSGPGILVQSCRISGKVCRHGHYSDFLFRQQVSFGSNHLSSSPTFGFAPKLLVGR